MKNQISPAEFYSMVLRRAIKPMAMARQANKATHIQEITCCVCRQPIIGDDIDKRVWLHEPDCNHGTDEWDGCDCDLECHAKCAPPESLDDED